MNDLLKTILPTAATMLGGPLAGIAVKFLAHKLGVPEATQEAVVEAMESAGMNPEGRVQLAQIDADLKKHALNIGLDIDKLAVANAADINATMQAEAKSEHWPTYSWRPSIGFAIAINVVMTTIIVLVAYCGVMFYRLDPGVLSHVPGMLGAMAALLTGPSAIVGVASWYRGKMQADPHIPTINRG